MRKCDWQVVLFSWSGIGSKLRTRSIPCHIVLPLVQRTGIYTDESIKTTLRTSTTTGPLPGHQCHVAAWSLPSLVINPPLCRYKRYKRKILEQMKSSTCF